MVLSFVVYVMMLFRLPYNAYSGLCKKHTKYHYRYISWKKKIDT